MEWAFSITDLNNMVYLGSHWKDSVKNKDVQNILEDLQGNIKFTRLYFGQEFCEKAIPGAEDIKRAIDKIKDMKFTFVTPYVTERGIAKLENVLKQLVKLKPRCEVVVNDWGVLELLRKKFPTFTPVLGRLLNKMLRDPRLYMYWKKDSQSDQISLLQSCSLTGSNMRKLLQKLNVSRIEMDNPPQGLDENLATWGYKVSLYVPYGCVTTGRVCLFRSWGLNMRDKFKTTDESCNRQCRSYWLKVHNSVQPDINNQYWQLLQKGTTIFYEQQKPFLKEGLKKAEEVGISRIVYQSVPL